MTLGKWLQQQHIPALEIKDTRQLTRHIRTHGTMAGKIVFDRDIPFRKLDTENLVAGVSIPNVVQEGAGDLTIALIDCGAKRNIAHCFVEKRRARHHRTLGL